MLSKSPCLAVLMLFTALAIPAQAGTGGLDYPVAPVSDIVDDFHGIKVADPYRGFEELDSPATRSWLHAEGELTDSVLTALPGRSVLRRQLAKLFRVETFRVPVQAAGHYFYRYNPGSLGQPVVYVTDSLKSLGKVALDPNTLSSDGSQVLVGFVPSHDGRLLAYGISVSGSDWTDWHVRDLESGKDLPDVIRWTKYYAPVFAADDRGLYYSAFPAPAPGNELAAQDLGNAVFFHALGTPAGSDRKLLEIPGHPDWQYAPELSGDGRWLVATSGEGEVGDKGLEDIWLIDLKAADPQPVAVKQGFAAAYVYVGSDAGQLFFVTSADAPNGKVVALDPEHPGAGLKTVVPEGQDAIDLTGPSVSLVDHQLIIQTIHDAHSRAVAYGLSGGTGREIHLPGVGTAQGFGGSAKDRYTFYLFTNLIAAPTIYAFEPATGHSTVFRAPTPTFDATRYEQRQVFYPGKDGTRIPMLLAYRKGLKLNGRNPTLLYAYGGFGIPLLPQYQPAVIEWMAQGGIYAIANIRGGGEYGESWHRQANRAHKQVVFDDFIAAAEWLIAKRYTSTPKLAIRGESNGGLLIGACITQRPELYGAAIAGVGVMDMLRFDRFGQGAGWTGEYGTPGDPADFPALRAYSPVHNVKTGTRYPATLIVTGDHDTRVMPMHSFKFTAALQAAQAGPAPILLYLEKSSGHGGGLTVDQEIEQSADIQAFLAERLGMSIKP